jgi:hypothetical protein
MSDEAIKPNFYQEFSTKVEEEVTENVANKDQQALAYITRFKGWELLKAYEGRLEELLDSMVNEAMVNMSMRELGERTMVKELSKLVLKSLIRKAEDARNAEEK